MANTGTGMTNSAMGKFVWQLSLFIGLVSLALGIVLTAHPSTSLNVIAVIIGLSLIVGGVFHFIRVLDADEHHRVWLGIAGLLEVVIGVVMIRHLHLTIAAIGLLVGLTWIVQGVVSFMVGILGQAGGSRVWQIIFGVISLAAGIVVVAVPTRSINVLAVLLGIWFIVMGLFEAINGLVIRKALKG